MIKKKTVYDRITIVLQQMCFCETMSAPSPRPTSPNRGCIYTPWLPLLPAQHQTPKIATLLENNFIARDHKQDRGNEWRMFWKLPGKSTLFLSIHGNSSIWLLKIQDGMEPQSSFIWSIKAPYLQKEPSIPPKLSASHPQNVVDSVHPHIGHSSYIRIFRDCHTNNTNRKLLIK